MDKKKFAKAELDENVKAFVVHITFLSLSSMIIHLAREAQIALLLAKEVKISSKYLDFLDVFPEEKTSVLLGQTKLNQHTIKLQNG